MGISHKDYEKKEPSCISHFSTVGAGTPGMEIGYHGVAEKQLPKEFNKAEFESKMPEDPGINFIRNW